MPDPRGRHRERPGRFDRPPFVPFGIGGPISPLGRFPFGRGSKARRGDVRAAALLLAEDPRNGYQLMQEIENRTRGLWRPSPGSMYPVLQQLEDEELVQPDGPEGRRVYRLTDTGRAYVKEHADELGTPWDAVCDSVDDNARDFHQLTVQVMLAARQVMHTGNTRQVDEAERVLANTRRSLYRILAEDDDSAGTEEER